MVRVATAWEILSNQETRKRYDSTRNTVPPPPTSSSVREPKPHQSVPKTDAPKKTPPWKEPAATVKKKAQADAREAQRRAQHYPRRWADMETWLNRLTSDFTDANYGSFALDREGDIKFPTAGRSVSGWVFILAGAIFGGVALNAITFTVVPPILEWLGEYSIVKNITSRMAHFTPCIFYIFVITLMIIVGPIFIGAWTGSIVHRWLGDRLKQNGHSPNNESRISPPHAADEQARASGSRIVACWKCGQRLRVPPIDSKTKIVISCKACGHKFEFPPG
jgi:DNA-directed RNA polymerase subunit RPC12/RpoP